MAKLLPLLLYLLAIILSMASTINASTYMVGDTSGWDISSDLDTWPQDKSFKVGDVLMFSYSSSNSLYQVTKQNYNNCNTSNPMKTYTNGNTTITLSAPGDMYFISGNKLYCLGGMKMQVHVAGDQAAAAGSPIGSPPQAQPSATKTLPVQPATKSHNPSTTSHGVSNYYGRGSNNLYSLLLGFVVSLLLWMLQA